MLPTLRRDARFPWILTSTILAILIPIPACAVWQQNSLVGLTTEYESNPGMSNANTGDVRRAILDLGYTLTGHFVSDLYRASLSLQILRSSNQQLNPNRENPTSSLEWQRQLENGDVGANVRLSEASTRQTGIESTVQAPASSIRSSRSVGAKWGKAVSARTRLSTEVMQENVSYNSSNFINYSSRSASLNVHYDWNERTTPYFRMLYNDYIPTDTLDYNKLQSATLGTTLNFSEQLSGSVELGRASTSNDDMISIGLVDVQYTQVKSVWHISADRHVAASGLGGYSIIDQTSGNWRYTLSNQSSTGIDFTLQHSQPVSPSTTVSTQGTRRIASIWLQNEIDQNWQLRTYFTHNILEIDISGTAHSNVAGISLTYTRPDF